MLDCEDDCIEVLLHALIYSGVGGLMSKFDVLVLREVFPLESNLPYTVVGTALG